MQCNVRSCPELNSQVGSYDCLASSLIIIVAFQSRRKVNGVYPAVSHETMRPFVDFPGLRSSVLWVFLSALTRYDTIRYDTVD